MKTTNDDPILDVAGAAEYLGQSERWIRRSVQERRFKFTRLGRKLGFRRSWLDAYVDAKTTDAEE